MSIVRQGRLDKPPILLIKTDMNNAEAFVPLRSDSRRSFKIMLLDFV